MFFYSKAQSEPDALNNMGIIYEDHFTDIPNAIQYFLSAIEASHVEAPLNLANLIRANSGKREVTDLIEETGHSNSKD